MHGCITITIDVNYIDLQEPISTIAPVRNSTYGLLRFIILCLLT